MTIEATLPVLAPLDDDTVVVASWGRATTVAIRWLASRQGLDATRPLGQLRAEIAPGDPPNATRVVRLAVDPYHWMVETFLATLRTPTMRTRLGLGEEYSYRQFLAALTAARHHADEARPGWLGVQAAAIEMSAAKVEVIDIDDPGALETLGPDLPPEPRRRTTSFDRVVADDVLTSTNERFVAPRSVCYYDDDTVAAVDALCSYEHRHLGFDRQGAGLAGGPPPRPAPARPGHTDIVAHQARVGDVQRCKRQLLSRGHAYLTRELAAPATRPMVFRHHDLVLLRSGRAASTFAVRWFLHHNGMTPESGVWPHELRTQVVYPSDWHRQRVRQVAASDPLAPMVRFARDPYRRAVSGYLHSLYQTQPRRSIAQQLGRTMADGYSFHDYLTALTDLVPQGRCDPHAYLQFHPLEHLAPIHAVFRVEDGSDRLRHLEADLALDPTSDEAQAAMQATGHQAEYRDDAGPAEAARRDFVPPVTPEDPVPRAIAFYDEATVALVDNIYASDFDRLGYPRRPVGEAGS